MQCDLYYFSEQVLIFYVGQVPSWFYGVLAEKDELAFKSITVKAVFLILGISFVSRFIFFSCIGICPEIGQLWAVMLSKMSILILQTFFVLKTIPFAGVDRTLPL